MKRVSINLCSRVAEISTAFEKCNTDLKKQYLIRNIELYNRVVNQISESCGTFGTGYPFYTLRGNLGGPLPIIKEQLRYNNELISAAKKSRHNIWHCFECLTENGDDMPDLKGICKPCPNIDDSLKPRKVMNRLPDIDMWMICKREDLKKVSEQLIELFNEYDIHSSDINPVQTILDVGQITEDLKSDIMPEKTLPFDAHIIDYETLYSLIGDVPLTIYGATVCGKIPYLPIHPLSYRKTWQYDDTAYNFIHDYLSSLTEFNFDEELLDILYRTREVVANSHSFEELYNILLSTGPVSVERRHKTKVLKTRFKERIDSWK